MLKTWTGRTKIEDDGAGTFVAQIATLGVIDKDQDVTVKGAFADAPTVRVSRFNHSSAVRDDLPVGVASIREDGDVVIAEGKLNLDTAGGKELYDTLKFEQDNDVSSEWSYGFTVEDHEDAEQDDQKVRLLKKLNPFEVSPVMRGAGENTATLSVKAEDTGQTLAEEADAALAAVTAYKERVASLADLRENEGRTLGAATQERLVELADTLQGIGDDLKALTSDDKPLDTSEMEVVANVAAYHRIIAQYG